MKVLCWQCGGMLNAVNLKNCLNLSLYLCIKTKQVHYYINQLLKKYISSSRVFAEIKTDQIYASTIKNNALRVLSVCLVDVSSIISLHPKTTNTVSKIYTVNVFKL